MKKITITIPVNLALEIASYGSDGKISRTAQLEFESHLKRMGYEEQLNEVRKEKLKKTAENLGKILGSDAMKKLDDTLKIAKDAMVVASRMNEKN